MHWLRPAETAHATMMKGALRRIHYLICGEMMFRETFRKFRQIHMVRHVNGVVICFCKSMKYCRIVVFCFAISILYTQNISFENNWFARKIWYIRVNND